MPKKPVPAGDLDRALAALIGKLPKVKVGLKFGHVNFMVGKKVFGFTRPEGLVLKLTQELADDLIAQGKAKRLVMGKREMKEWVVLRHPKAADYKKDLPLIKKSIEFTSSKS